MFQRPGRSAAKAAATITAVEQAVGKCFKQDLQLGAEAAALHTALMAQRQTFMPAQVHDSQFISRTQLALDNNSLPSANPSASSRNVLGNTVNPGQQCKTTVMLRESNSWTVM